MARKARVIARVSAPRLTGFLFATLALLGSFGCEEETERDEARSTSKDLASSASTIARPKSTAPPNSTNGHSHGRPPGDADRGKQLIATFECNRCHEVEGHTPAEASRHCVACHDDIWNGTFKAPASAMARWKKTVDPYTVAPALERVGERFDAGWVYAFLRSPFDLRPHLDPSMPRLELTEQQASDIVAHLTASAPNNGSALAPGDPARGRKLMDQKGCASCHAFSGVPAFSVQPDPKVSDEQQKRAVRLAPDLRFARQRFRKSSMVAWLLDPKKMKPSTRMPTHGLNAREAADVAAYIYDAELEPVPQTPIPERLPVLERRVGFQEVMDQVFGVTCRHCHSDPDAALGDGGPGNSGGFGFKPKGLDLATYRGIAAGFLDGGGERQSVFLPLKGGTPRLLAVLLARQMEEAGKRHEEVRGMPLGLPALTAEQVQLVESWIAQGRPK